jgi:hypothetical protein
VTLFYVLSANETLTTSNSDAKQRANRKRKEMTINYAQEINSRIISKEISATNAKKMQNVSLIASKASVQALLASCNVSADRFNARAIYATEKTIKACAAVTQEHVTSADFNDNVLATIKTLALCIKAKEKLHKSDIEAAMSKDIKVAETRKAFVYQRNALQSAATVNAQSQQCIDMLRTLNAIREVSKNVFEIDAKNEFLKLAIKKTADLSV